MRRLRGCGAWRMSSMRASRCIWQSCRCPHTSRCTSGAARRALRGVQDSASRLRRAPAPQALALQRLEALGFLRPGFSAIGALGCEGQDLELLAHHGACVIGCPQAELRLGAVPRALPGLAGAHRALGTDSPAACGARPARRGAHAALLSSLPAEGALRLATLGGATGARARSARSALSSPASPPISSASTSAPLPARPPRRWRRQSCLAPSGPM